MKITPPPLSLSGFVSLGRRTGPAGDPEPAARSVSFISLQLVVVASPNRIAHFSIDRE